MLDVAIDILKPNEHPLVHSDRGCHYRWPGWIERMEQAKLTRSMSKKGCSPDNSACEGFFGRLKNEMFYNRKWDAITIDEFATILDGYLCWYGESRIKKSFGNLKDRLDMRRMSVSSEENFEGKLFVQFVVLELMSYIKKQMDVNNLYKNYTMQSMLDTLDIIEYYQQPGRTHHLSEITEKQQTLYKLIGVEAPT